MTPAQTSLYFREWGKVRAHYIGKDIDPKQAENKRHELHKRALGADKSSKDFTNGDLDRVLAAFYAITRPDDLTAQLHQIDQAESRTGQLIQRVKELASRCVNKPGVEGFYLDGMSNKIFGQPRFRDLDEKRLAQLCGILQRRIAQLNNPARARGKQAPGELRPITAPSVPF